MKTLLRSLALVAFGAVMIYGIGIAVAGSPPGPHRHCPDCPMAATDNAASRGMEKMQAHLERMKGAMAALRESESKLAATEDPKAFRAAVIEHLKKLDDIQAAHLTHMETMMGRMEGGMPGMGHRHGRDCGCRDCAHKGDCDCDCCPECGHGH